MKGPIPFLVARIGCCVVYTNRFMTGGPVIVVVIELLLVTSDELKVTAWLFETVRT